MVEIARLPVDRWEEVKRLRLEALRTDPAAFGSSPEEDEALPEAEWKRRMPNSLFAISDDKPVGMIAFLFGNRAKSKHIADIFAVYVTPGQRGKGVGTLLLETTLSEIRRNKEIRKIKLMVNPEQRAAVRLYKAAGFVVAGKAKREFKVGRRYVDMVYMEKELR